MQAKRFVLIGSTGEYDWLTMLSLGGFEGAEGESLSVIKEGVG